MIDPRVAWEGSPARPLHPPPMPHLAALRFTTPVLVALLGLPVFALGQAAPGVSTSPPTVEAQRLEGALRIDGALDEAAWAAAPVAGGFTESWPNEGVPARLPTVARILYDDDAVYVGVRMSDVSGDSVTAQLARRDATGIYSDWITVTLDSYHDRRTAFAFGVNPRGVKRDIYLSNDTNEDFGWDAVWEVATRIDSAGWTAEFRIPHSQLRMSRGEPAGGRTWGLQVARDIARLQTRYMWAPWVRSDNAFVSRFGTVTGLRGVRAPTQLELLPYSVARLTRAPGQADNPFHRANDAAASAGADVRLGLRSGFTLNATINPDFGQVELDPAIVNLSAFEVQLPERRPFFVEGTDVFRFGSLLSYISQGSPQFFYSRRIGRAPQRNLAFEDDILFDDAPPTTTILGAVKLTGKTTNGWTVGVLDAVTSREEAPVLTDTDERLRLPVEPLSNYLVGRVRRDLNAGRTVVGAIATAASRALRDSVFAPMLRSDAYVAGLDAEHSWADRMWAVSGFAAASTVTGSEEAIAAAQRSSARYFTRPDAGDYLTYDPTRTALGGYVAGAALRKGGAWRGSLWYQEVSPGLEVNDLGFQGRTDYRGISALFGKRQDKQGPVFRDWFVRAFGSSRWNYGGDRIMSSAALRGNATLKNLWSVSGTVDRGFDVLDDRLTRGGPIAAQPGSWSFAVGAASDPRKPFSGGADVYTADDDAGGYVRFASAFMQGRPSTTVQFSLSPFIEQTRTEAQYVRSRVDDLATGTYGRRYVFSRLAQTTVGMSTRLDWTFTPALSVQTYARPFISAGRYTDFGELSAPRTFDFARYGRDAGTIATSTACGSTAPSPSIYVVDPDGAGPASCFTIGNPDFNFRNLRGSAVLRWEYRPGSTLFLVWQQERSDEVGIGRFDVLDDARDLFRAPARNVLLVKATYWLSL